MACDKKNPTLLRLNIRLRYALQASIPRPTKKEIEHSLSLHHVLTEAGLLKPVPYAGPGVVIPPLVEEMKLLGLPIFLPVEMEGQQTRVGVFLNLLHRAKTSSECTICCETKPTRDVRSVIAAMTRAQMSSAQELLEALSGFPSIDEVGPKHAAHLQDVCRGCLATYLSHEVGTHRDTIHSHIRCPVDDCQEALSEAQLKKHLADAETIQKYDRLSVLQAMSTEEDFRWCLTPGCDYGAIWYVRESCSMLSCPACDHSQCYYHKVPWRLHAGLTCEKYDKKLRATETDPDADSQAWLERQTKPCPQCRVRISKGPGCFHMSCTQCQYEFCWQCSAE